MSDLFGHAPPPPAQSDFFAHGAMAPPRQSYDPDPADIRTRLTRLLETARAAEAMPWPPKEALMWRTVFPNMANWLPAAEADRMRADWRAEMARLDAVRLD